MKKVTVYADFDFLESPQEIGTLGYERVRGKDHFIFEYSHEWLKMHAEPHSVVLVLKPMSLMPMEDFMWQSSRQGKTWRIRNS